jgi:hypothetical protein
LSESMFDMKLDKGRCRGVFLFDGVFDVVVSLVEMRCTVLVVLYKLHTCEQLVYGH